MLIDYYEVLGVERTADHVEIRRAYKRLALSHHPDKVPEEERADAEHRFKEISEAYEILSDPDARIHYDTFGTADGGGPPGWQDSYDPEFGPEAFAEFFGFGGGFTNGGANGGANGAYGANGFHGGANGSNGFHSRSRTDDADIEVDVSMEDIYRGRVLKMATSRQVLCKSCNGLGARSNAKPKKCGACDGSGSTKKLRQIAPGVMTADYMPCDACKGRGQVYRDKDLCKRCKGTGTTEEKSMIEVYIPRGAKNGYRVVLQGKADMAYGKETGDIVVTVQVQDHPEYTRVGDDLYAKTVVSLSEALQGFSRTVITQLDGRGLSVTVNPGTVTKPGSIFKVTGEGMPRSGTESRGDLYIEVDVQFPDHLDAKTAEELKRVLPALSAPPLQQEPTEVDEVDVAVITAEDLPKYQPEEDQRDGAKRPGCCIM